MDKSGIAALIFSITYVGSEAVQVIQQPGDTDRDQTGIYFSDTGFVPETIRQEAAYPRPRQEKPGKQHLDTGNTG